MSHWSIGIDIGGTFTDFASCLLKNKIFNKFYLYKSPKNLSKEIEYLKFNSLDVLKKNYKNKFNLNLYLGKDKITLYKN